MQMASLSSPVPVWGHLNHRRIQARKPNKLRIFSQSKKQPEKIQKKNHTTLYWAAFLGLGCSLLAHSSGDVAEAINLDKLQLHNVGEVGMAEGGKEFWDNMKSYAVFFFTVVTGGFYSIFKPLFDLLTNPVTAVFAVFIIGGSLYLLYLTLSAMFGINEYPYPY